MTTHEDQRTYGGAQVGDRIPVDRVEAEVRLIFEQILPGGYARPWENLFTIGGSSLHALLAFQRINAQLGVELVLSEFFADGTVQGVARMVREQLRSRGAGTDVDGANTLVLVPNDRAAALIRYLPDELQQLSTVVVPNAAQGQSISIDVEGIAAATADRILAAGEPPRAIVGYCVAAGAAAELANVLAQRGAPIDRLVLLDPTFAEHMDGVAMTRLLELMPQELEEEPELTQLLADFDEIRAAETNGPTQVAVNVLLEGLAPYLEHLLHLTDRTQLTDSEREFLLADYRSWVLRLVAASLHSPNALRLSPGGALQLVTSAELSDRSLHIVKKVAASWRVPTEHHISAGGHFAFLSGPEVAEAFRWAVTDPSAAPQ